MKRSKLNSGRMIVNGAFVWFLFILSGQMAKAQFMQPPSTINNCAGAINTFTFVPEFPGAYVDYWQVNGVRVTPLPPPAGPIQYDVVGVPGTMTVSVFFHSPDIDQNIHSTTLFSYNVLPQMSAPIVTGPSAVCSGSGAVQYSTESGNSNYVWVISGGTILSGANTSTVTVNWTSLGNQFIGVTFTNVDGCSRYSGNYNVSVSLSAVSQPLTGGGNYCAVGPGLSVGLASSQLTVNYQLADATTGVPFGSIIAGTGNAIGWTGLTLATGSYKIIASSPACPSINIPFVVQRDVTIALQTVSLIGGTICPGGSASIVLGGSQNLPGAFYRLQTPTGFIDKPGTGGPLTWSGLTQAGSYTVSGISPSCPVVTMSPTVNVTVNPGPVAAFTGNNSFCSGGSTVLTATTGAGYSYQWVKNGVDMAGQTASILTATTAGSYAIRTTLGSCSTTSSVLAVQEITPPAAITGVGGIRLSFVGETNRYFVQGAADATNIVWNTVPAGVSLTDRGGSIVNQDVNLAYSTVGKKRFVLTPYKSGCPGTPYNLLQTSIKPSIAKVDTFKYFNTRLVQHDTAYMFLRSRNTPAPCTPTFGEADAQIKLDLGDIYNWGSNAFNRQVDLAITAHYEYPGVEQSWTTSLYIDQNTPEREVYKRLNLTPDLLRTVQVSTVQSIGTSAAINLVRLTGSVVENNQINVASNNISGLAVNNVLGKWEQTFSWNQSCNNATDFQLQLARVYEISKPVDWSQALSVETDTSATSLTLTVAEGSGIYRWRVRAIGSKPDGIANPDNWGPWSAENEFTFTQPEENKNWIYSRTFAEGLKIREQVTYANGLQQIAQQQARLRSANQIVANQLLSDYVGRVVIKSLPVPIPGKTDIGYQPNLLQDQSGILFTPDKYDVDPKVATPLARVQGDYYGGTDITINGKVINKGVANAEGYPYARTLYTNDGTGRVIEQSGVGVKHSIAATNGGKTVRTFYSGVNEGELLSVFGKESPDPRSVQKIVTVDANDVSTISYKAKDGKVIATAMTAGANTSMDILPSQAARTVFEKVSGGVRISPSVISTTKPMLFTQTTNVVVDYDITPSLVRSLSTDPTGALKAEYQMEGTGNDASGNGNSALVLNGPAQVAGVFNTYGYSLDGIDDYLSIGDNPSLDFGADDFTISMWVNKSANSAAGDNGWGGIAKWNSATVPGTNEWDLALSSNGTDNVPAFFVESGFTTYSVAASTNLAVGTWYHVAAMRKAGQLLIFVNGTLQGTSNLPSATTSINNLGLPVYIGRIATAGFYSNAKFDEVKIFRRALSSTEVADQFSCGVSICKTCDYKVEFYLHRSDDPNYTYGTLPSQTIAPGDCSQQASLKWDPVSFTLTGLAPNVPYVLEKRISVYNTNPVSNVPYLEEQIAALKASKNASLDAALATINAFVTANDLAGLYNYLQAQNYAFDAVRNHYVVPLTCGDIIYVPKEALCEDLTPDPSCKVGGQTWEQYFEAQNGNTVQGNKLLYAWYTNKYTNQKEYFVRGQLDAMMDSLLVNNGGSKGLVTCQDVWNVWLEETKTYTSWTNDSIPAYIPNPVEDFLNELEAKLDDRRPTVAGTNYLPSDFCTTAGPFYFLKKTQVYGKVGGAVIPPDLTHAYSLIYFNQDIPGHINSVKSLTSPNLSEFDQVTEVTITGGDSRNIPGTINNECNRYQLYRITHDGKFLNNPITSADSAYQIVRINCETVCSSRREEFKQAVILNILSQNPTAKIEHYQIITSSFNGQTIAVLDSTFNTTGPFAFLQCEIEQMADALVENCQRNYCRLSVQPDGSLGSATEIANTQKVFNNQFQVVVGGNGQSCPGFDYLSPSVISMGDPPTSDQTDGFVFGATWGTPSNPADFLPGRVFTVTKTQNDGLTGSWDWALNQCNALGGTQPVLINFNIPGNGPHTILGTGAGIVGSKPVIVDATTQPSTINSQPRVIINSSAFPNFYALNFSGCNGSSVKGLELIGPLLVNNSNNFSLIGNIIRLLPAQQQVGGIVVHFQESNSLTIQGNVIGTDHDLSGDFGNTFSLSLDDASNSLIGGPTRNHGNILANDKRVSLEIDAVSSSPIGSDNNLIQNNIILNHYDVVARNGAAILQQGGLAQNSNNRYTRNLIFVNQNQLQSLAMSFSQGDNANKQPPVIQSLTAQNGTFVASGTSGSNDIIEVFLTSVAGNNLVKFLGTTTANAAGSWSLAGLQVPATYSIAATATDPQNNTSTLGYWTNTIGLSCVSTHSVCFQFTATLTQTTIVVPASMPTYDPQIIPCAQVKGTKIKSSIEDQRNAILSAVELNFRSGYFASCPDPASLIDNLTISYPLGIFHHTLYYYDRGGHLMRTVPPKGVAYLSVTTTAELAAARNVYPAHTLDTRYEYNSLGQMVKQSSPDAGTSQFWYNDIGLLRFAQSAQQAIDQKYSYTKYDNLGRIIEVGEATGFNATNLVANRNDLSYPAGGTQVTKSFYNTDIPTTELTLPNNLVQRYLRNRISYSIVDDDGSDATLADRTITAFSYDPHGTVEWFVQKIAGFDRVILVTYEYDLISGNVLRVNYNPGQVDQFYHRYEYNGDNKLRSVFTSRDGLMWDRDANYRYHLHGPLLRTLIGEDQVQGLDYTYTIRGWIKAFNNPYDLQNLGSYNAANDPGGDGLGASLTAKDAFGMVIQYFSGDYKHTGHQVTSGAPGELLPMSSPVARDLYNGNIAAWTSNTRYPATANVTNKGLTGQQYTYDQLNRIKSSVNNVWSGGAYATTTNYASTYTYDANGNIITSTNAGDATNSNLDDLTYVYAANSNKLSQVVDAVPVTAFTQDVENQAPNNYTYDAVGNLIADAQQNTSISWTAYGKVQAVVKPGGFSTQFRYDAHGNRVSKRMTNPAGLTTTDFYVHDPSGLTLAIYTKTEQSGLPDEVALEEFPIYGSERIGEYRKSIDVIGPGTAGGASILPGESRISANTSLSSFTNTSYLLNSSTSLTLAPGFTFTANSTGGTFSVRVSANTAGVSSDPDVYSREIGLKSYEMKDHLGNVRALVTDVKQSTITANVPGAYEPEITAVNNYYSFGMDQPGRMWSAGKYRYGFNGKEKDQTGEWGTNAYDYGFRIYSPSIAKFLSVDPLTNSYPSWSPFPFAMNRPIDGVDIDGLEWKAVTRKYETNTIYTGFVWDPTNSRDQNGELKEGYFETAIVFSEKGKIPDPGQMQTWHAIATVYRDDGTTKTYDATTLPSDTEKFGTVAPGMYKAFPGLHPMNKWKDGPDQYPALNVYTLDGSRSLPALNDFNPSDGGKYVTGVNVHLGGRLDWLGTFDHKGRYTGVSEGCFCIFDGKEKKQNLYANFLANFPDERAIGIILLRGKIYDDGLRIPSGDTFIGPGRERSLYERVKDYLFRKSNSEFDEKFWDRYERTFPKPKN